jgi:hypothetical protein
VYEIHSGDRGDELRATPRLVGYRTVGRDVNLRGDTYQMRAGCFHRTVASEATTVVIGRDRPGEVDLSLGAVDGRSHVIRRQRCGRTTTARAARLVAAQLQMNWNR